MATVLIVDDSETLRSQLRKHLEQAQLTVLEAVDGVDGLEKYRSHPEIKLVICDVNMPNMDGMTMIEKVRQIEAGKNIPVLMLTTESGADLKARGKELGLRAWVTKPYVAETLVAAVKKLVQ